jgi:hypothetical protein
MGRERIARDGVRREPVDSKTRVTENFRCDLWAIYRGGYAVFPTFKITPVTAYVAHYVVFT